MFDTSIVRSRAATAPRQASLFTASLIAHATAVLAAIALSVASVEFPVTAPDEYALAPVPIAVRIPPPLGTPEGGPRRSVTPAVERQTIRPAEPVAPALVPDVVAPVEPMEPAGGRGTGETSSDPAGGGTLGVPWGVEGGMGDAGPTIEETPPAGAIYEIGGEVKAPVAVYRVEPPYPRSLLPTRMAATVVVRCVIGMDGRVRDPLIVSGSLPPFNEAVMAAVRQWRFTPGSLRGNAVETWFDLTVRFSAR